jgi:hypothetical protein
MKKKNYMLYIGIAMVLVFGVVLSACGGVELPKANKDRCDVNYRHNPTTNAELKEVIATEIALLGDTADLKYIDTSGVGNMSNAFGNNTTFNGDLSCWNTGNVTRMISLASAPSSSTASTIVAEFGTSTPQPLNTNAPITNNSEILINIIFFIFLSSYK